MAQRTAAELKTFFETGDRPTAEQFIDFIDSSVNILDDGASVLPSMMTEINLSGKENIFLPLYLQSVDKSLVTSISVVYGYLTGLPNLDALVNLEELNCNLNQLTSLPSLPISILTLSCNDNFLTAQAVSQSLIDLDGNGLSNGYIDLSSEGPGSAGFSQLTDAGLVAYNNLIGNGWSIGINA